MAEAADQLGVSVVTIRRMIKRGQLEAQRVVRPQGSAYLVSVPDDGTEDASPTEQPAQNVSRTQGTPEQAITMMIQATLTPVLAPLVAEITASRQTIERQSEQLIAQAETIGRQAAEIEALRAQPSTLAPSGATERPDPSGEPATPPAPFPAPLPPTPNERRWWPGQGPLRAVLGSIALAVLLMLVWWLGH